MKLEKQPGRSHVTGYISREDDATFLLLTLRYRPYVTDLTLPTLRHQPYVTNLTSPTLRHRPLASLCSNPSLMTRSAYKETGFLTSWINKLQYGKLNWPLHQLVRTYHGSQKDALFLNFILINNSTCFRQTYCPASGVLTLYSQQLVYVILVILTEQRANITNIKNTSCCECTIKTPDDGQ